MPARIAATLTLKNRPGLPLFCAYLLALLFISPASSLGQTNSHSPGWVVLPVEEYRTLHARAYPIERDPEPPPVEATLTRVDYDLRIDGELASGRASLTVDVLKDGWVRVPIPAGLLVREARLDGKLVSLVPGAGSKAGSQLSALLSHSGRAVLLLDIAIPVVSATGEESITLPATPPALLAHPCSFLARAWTSDSRAASSLRNPNPRRKASGLLTDAGTNPSPSLGAGRPRTTAPRSLCECADR